MAVLLAAFMLHLMMRLAGFEIALGADAEAEQHGARHIAVLRGDHRRLAGDARGDFGLDAFEAGGVDQVGLVEHDQVGAGQLILEQFLDRAFVIERFVLNAGGIDLVVIVGKTAGGDGGAIDHRHDTVDRHLRADIRPVEGGDQRLRQGKAGGFDDDMIRAVLALQQPSHGRDEIVGDGAADAAIGQFDDVVLGAGFRATALEHIAIDAEIAEFIDDQRDFPAACVGEQVADHRRLAGAEKAGNDGCRNLLHKIIPSFSAAVPLR